MYHQIKQSNKPYDQNSTTQQLHTVHEDYQEEEDNLFHINSKLNKQKEELLLWLSINGWGLKIEDEEEEKNKGRRE